MSCQICRSSAGYFNSKTCENGHDVHKVCLKNPKNNSLLTDCRYCVKLIYKNQDCNGKICIVCQMNPVSEENKCKSYKNMCDTCQENFIFKKHYADCKNCREKHNYSVTICFKCEEYFPKSHLYNSPRCKFHQFCRNCLNSSGKLAKPCDPCNFYFCFLSKIIQQNEVLCNLCGKYPEGKIFNCQLDHSYCKYCIQYLNPTLMDILNRLKACEFCTEKFNKYFKGETSESNSIKQNPIIEDPEPPSEFLLNDLGHNQEIKEFEIKNPEYDKIEPQVAEKKEEKKNKKRRKKMKDNESLLTVNQFFGVNDKCGTCNINPGIGFECGHFNCKICLGRVYIKDLMYIFALIESKFFDRIPKKFRFTCITPDCRQEIHIPSEMIIHKVQSRLEPKHLSMYYTMGPYFDGIPMEIKLCACLNLTLSSSFFKLFCTCSSN